MSGPAPGATPATVPGPKLSVAPNPLRGPLPPRWGPEDPGGPGPKLAQPLNYRSAPPDAPGTRGLFYGLFAVLAVGLIAGLGTFVVLWRSLASVALFLVVSLLLVGAAYGIARQLVALVSRRRELESLSTVPSGARVALLYTTMNDVVPECLDAIRQSYPSDVFVLDDSTDPLSRRTVDAIAARRGYAVVRRGHRRGFKAGAVNEWYAQHRDRYDYIVLLDADSYLPPDWVGEALRYAEHPANRRVAIFQGLINIWNLDTRFVQTLAPMSRVGQFVWEERLANSLDAVFCYGHNCLLRVRALDEIGGIVEGFVSEDFATAVALADRDWHSRFLPLHTYEAMPENVRGFVKRQNKWTRGAMEFVGFSRRSNLPASRKLHLWQTPLGHFTNVLLPVGMFLAVFGYASTPGAAVALLGALARNPLATLWGISLFRYLLVVTLLGSIPEALVLLRCRIGWRTYWHHRWLSAAVGTVALPYEIRSMVVYLLRGIRSIPVTPKSEAPLGAGEVLHLARFSLAMNGALLVGLVLFNPVGALFNATWLVPMLVAPAVILRFSGPPAEPVRGFETTEDSSPSPARERRVRAVHATLQSVREPAPSRSSVAV